MTDDSVLSSDPVFQLDVLLWALEDLPAMTAFQFDASDGPQACYLR